MEKKRVRYRVRYHDYVNDDNGDDGDDGDDGGDGDDGDDDDDDCRHTGCTIGDEVSLIGKNTGTVWDAQ